MSATTLAPRARRRILWFSLGLWVFCALVVGTIVTVSLVLSFTRAERAVLAEVWNRADAPVATADGDTWSGTGDARIVLPDDLAAQAPLLLTFAGTSDEYFAVRQTEAGQDTVRDSPAYLGSLSTSQRETVAIMRPGSALWVTSRGPWSVRIAPLKAQELTGTVTGTGSRYLLYRGDALSGTLRQEGDAFLVLDAYDGTSVQSVTTGQHEPSMRISWNRAPGAAYVVFHVDVDVDGSGTWSLTADQLVTPAPTGGGG